jgi:hypothetical protein
VSIEPHLLIVALPFVDTVVHVVAPLVPPCVGVQSARRLEFAPTPFVSDDPYARNRVTMTPGINLQRLWAALTGSGMRHPLLLVVLSERRPWIARRDSSWDPLRLTPLLTRMLQPPDTQSSQTHDRLHTPPRDHYPFALFSKLHHATKPPQLASRVSAFPASRTSVPPNY